MINLPRLHQKIVRKLKQPMGLWALTALVTGNMIGSGVFLLPASLGAVGAISLCAWLLTGFGALCLAYLFMCLSRKSPMVGGPYAYVHAGAGRFLSFQTAYCYWLAICTGNAATALAGVGYAALLWPHLQSAYTACWTAIAVVWALTAINCLGVYLSGKIQLITTILKFFPLLLVAFFGWQWIHAHYYTAYWNITVPKQSDVHALFHGATLTLWAFVGLESATIPADQVKEPGKNIPRATIIGTVIAVLIYSITSSVIMGMIPATSLQHSTHPFSDVASLMLGYWGGGFVAIGAMIACFGSLNGWILLQGQIPMSAAQDQLFPRLFAKRNRYSSPAIGMFISSSFITALLLLTVHSKLVKQFETIILLAVLATLIPYFYTALSALIFRKKLIDHPQSKVFLFMASCAVIYTSWMMLSLNAYTLTLGALLLLSSIPVYLLLRVKRNKRFALSD